MPARVLAPITERNLPMRLVKVALYEFGAFSRNGRPTHLAHAAEVLESEQQRGRCQSLPGDHVDPA